MLRFNSYRYVDVFTPTNIWSSQTTDQNTNLILNPAQRVLLSDSSFLPHANFLHLTYYELLLRAIKLKCIHFHESSWSNLISISLWDTEMPHLSVRESQISALPTTNYQHLCLWLSHVNGPGNLFTNIETDNYQPVNNLGIVSSRCFRAYFDCVTPSPNAVVMIQIWFYGNKVRQSFRVNISPHIFQMSILAIVWALSCVGCSSLWPATSFPPPLSYHHPSTKPHQAHN